MTFCKIWGNNKYVYWRRPCREDYKGKKPKISSKTGYLPHYLVFHWLMFDMVGKYKNKNLKIPSDWDHLYFFGADSTFEDTKVYTY